MRHPGFDVTNHGEETLTFGAHGSGFDVDAYRYPLTLRPGDTWVEAQHWKMMVARSEPLRDALAEGVLTVGGDEVERPAF